MSSYYLNAKDKEGNVVYVEAIDDYFGKHKYGYKIVGEGVLTEEEFCKKFMKQITTEEWNKKVQDIINKKTVNKKDIDPTEIFIELLEESHKYTIIK